MGKNKTVIYTCITGGYDDLRLPQNIEADVDYICFTDNPAIVHAPWQYRPVADLNIKGNKNINRFVKMHPHIVLPEYEQSIYVDGYIQVIDCPSKYIDEVLSGNNIALYNHPFRKNLYEEVDICIKYGHVFLYTIRKQVKAYRDAGFPDTFPLFECGVLFRKHHSADIIQLMNDWWQIYTTGVKRDQLSFSYVAWKNKTSIHQLGESDPRFGHKHFFLHLEHNKEFQLKQAIVKRINKILNLTNR